MATQSLYRRYRPQRFSELKGQDHIVRALRDAVATGREGQAYLFSGPRGTGKTTTARILAKVLNCENPTDGEPCGECESCKAVERGASYDVHELDAASNNGVDAIRDLVEKASLGTPGRHKVYILDEVHMLSKAASAALLKTLEEPPAHVVFVLATTDPQKVLDTIRSRTQHLQFHLLPADTLAEHVKWVADDAGLELSQAALDAALVQGGGSARDTLSALELLASSGGEVDDVVDLDEFLAALVDRDAGRALTAMGHAINLGRDPRTVTEDVVRALRNSFLALMAPELVVLPADRIDAIAAQAQQLGAAALVKAIEKLGTTMVEMRNAPDPRILVEVALVQLTHDEAGDDVDALVTRIERLEQTVKQLRDAPPASSAAPRDPSTGRAVLGGAARRPTKSEPISAADALPDQSAPASDTAPEAPETAAPRAPSVTIADAWEQTVKAQVKPLVRALYSAGTFTGQQGSTGQFRVPNEAHRGRCDAHRPAVEQALSEAVGDTVTIEFVIGDSDGGGGDSAPEPRPTPPATSTPATTPAPDRGPAPSPQQQAREPEPPDEPPPAPRAAPQADDEIDLSELTDVPPESVKTTEDHLAEAFPGSEFVNED